MPKQQKHQSNVLHDRFLGGENLSPWQLKLNEIIFGVETPAGRAFDVVLLIAILISIAAVMLESVDKIGNRWGAEIQIVEWTLTLLFTAEYVLRLLCVQHRTRYAFSFYGIIDLLSILPTYLAVFVAGSHSLVVIRGLRLIRIFRILKVVHCMREAELLWIALKATIGKITVFMVVVMTIVLIMGSTMYLIEGAESGFTSIPKSVYWTIVTITTVGYGDIAPQTALGQTLAAIIMLLGYGIIIVPTGMFSVEIINASKEPNTKDHPCPGCNLLEHDTDALFCKRCGNKLFEVGPEVSG